MPPKKNSNCCKCCIVRSMPREHTERCHAHCKEGRFNEGFLSGSNRTRRRIRGRQTRQLPRLRSASAILRAPPKPSAPSCWSSLAVSRSTTGAPATPSSPQGVIWVPRLCRTARRWGHPARCHEQGAHHLPSCNASHCCRRRWPATGLPPWGSSRRAAAFHAQPSWVASSRGCGSGRPRRGATRDSTGTTSGGLAGTSGETMGLGSWVQSAGAKSVAAGPSRGSLAWPPKAASRRRRQDMTALCTALVAAAWAHATLQGEGAPWASGSKPPLFCTAELPAWTRGENGDVDVSTMARLT
mmetsp:Transcript_53803/g.162767  ORF Transcript_53803/g.162767 Transcript_53803/m.162767 type:complete len:298 (+) Transcript_53803:50-943(+)